MRVAILGIGNVLMGDDALGPYVVALLEAAWERQDGLQLLDAGTPGLDLTAYLAELDAVLVVDVVKASGPPGEVRAYGKAELVERPPVLAMSPHEPGLREAILNADFQGVCPRSVRLVGVIPESVDYRLGLSAPVRAALPEVVERIRQELAALGVTPAARAAPAEPDLWWERKASA
ncbi:MAG TPA: hydrogenase maturation protease [Anaeromyxobacteraceae bacterium]|nr:hydrogenase maturation protease [Anaeromyxobacteraceae bacterium]